MCVSEYLMMDRRTILTQSVPGFMDAWKKYKKGLKNIKIADWCISSDYCFGDVNKLDVATFTIFPVECMQVIDCEVKDNLPHDIKEVKQFSEKGFTYLKNSKYFFSISVVIENLKYAFNEEKALREFSDVLKFYDISDIDKNNESIKERHLQLVNAYNYLRQKSHSRVKLSQMYFVAQFVSIIMEFLLIKEKGRDIRWCSDRGHIASFLDGIMFNLVPVYLRHNLRGRVIDFHIHLPLEIKENKNDYPYDVFIRIPDIITGVMSSLVVTEGGITVQKEKHGQLVHKSIVDNPHIVTILCHYLADSRPMWQRLFFESINKSPAFRYDDKLLNEFQNNIDN